jgi:hypothetical protein
MLEAGEREVAERLDLWVSHDLVRKVARRASSRRIPDVTERTIHPTLRSPSFLASSPSTSWAPLWWSQLSYSTMRSRLGQHGQTTR